MASNKKFQRKHNWLPISEQIRLKHKTISRHQARLIIEKHPHLQHNREDRLFLLELIKWAQRKDPDTGLPYVHYYEIAAVFDKSPKHCNTEQELEGVKQRFLHALEWTGYSNNENENERGKARMITNTGLGELANAFLYDYDPERVYADSLKPFSKRKQADACRARKRENEVIRWSYIDQQVIADYLRGHSLQQFKRVVDANYYTALMEAFRCKDSGSQLSLLSEIKDMPQPLYYPSGRERSRCPRIFGKGIPMLKYVQRGYYQVRRSHARKAVPSRSTGS